MFELCPHRVSVLIARCMCEMWKVLTASLRAPLSRIRCTENLIDTNVWRENSRLDGTQLSCAEFQLGSDSWANMIPVVAIFPPQRPVYWSCRKINVASWHSSVRAGKSRITGCNYNQGCSHWALWSHPILGSIDADLYRHGACTTGLMAAHQQQAIRKFIVFKYL